MITENTFDQYAAGYAEKFNRNALARYQRKQVHDLLRQYLQPGQSLLDVGCGPGSDFHFYRSLSLKVTASDISGQMIARAQAEAERLNLDVRLQHTALANFQSGDRYPVILLNFGVINVFPDLRPVFDKLFALLAPRGILAVVSMPPFHLATFVVNVLRSRWKDAMMRIRVRQAALANGLKIYYYNQADFAPFAEVVQRRHLCPLLPAPDHYAASRLLRGGAHLLKGLDARLSGHLPDWVGGDHVTYVLRERTA